MHGRRNATSLHGWHIGGPLLALLFGGEAAAQPGAPEGGAPKVVALLPCTGQEAALPPKNPLQPPQTARAVLALLRDRPGARYRVLAPDRWSEVARRRFRGRTTELQGIAQELRAELVVGCWLEAQGSAEAVKPYRLTVALYNNWAEPLGQISFDLERPLIDVAALRERAQPLYQQVDYGLGLLPPPEKKPPAAPRPAPGVAQAEDSEPTPLPPQQPVRGPGAEVPLVPPNREAQELYYRRPPWRPILDLEGGYLYNFRHMTDNGSGRSFNTSGAHGLRIHGELYPLAGLRRVPAAAAGLGVRATLLVPFWPDVKQLNDRGEQTGLYGASEYRVEVGWLRWRHNFLGRALRTEAPVQPEVELEGLYGYHRFDFAAKENILVLDIPNAAYSYLGAAAALRLHVVRRVQLRFGLAFAGMLGLGQMGEPGAPNDDPVAAGRNYPVYGPGGGWLWRTDIGFRLRLVAGLLLGVSGSYEQKLLSFEGTGDVLLLMQPPEGPKQKVTAVKDEYGGLALSLGYAY